MTRSALVGTLGCAALLVLSVAAHGCGPSRRHAPAHSTYTVTGGPINEAAIREAMDTFDSQGWGTVTVQIEVVPADPLAISGWGSSVPAAFMGYSGTQAAYPTPAFTFPGGRIKLAAGAEGALIHECVHVLYDQAGMWNDSASTFHKDPRFGVANRLWLNPP